MYRDIEKIEKMEKAAKICSRILAEVVAAAQPGTTLLQLDILAETKCHENSVKPAFKGYNGYPATINANINDIVVHGIPDSYELVEGDILGIDFGVVYKGVYSDMSVTIPIGEISDSAKNLILVTKKALLAGVDKAVVGNRVGDIGAAMQEIVESAGYSVVREMVGHGVGYDLHEDPTIPGYGKAGTGPTLYDGQTVAIELLVNEGSRGIFLDIDDGWTMFTEDGKLSALYEHTVVVGEEPKVLTQWPNLSLHNK